MILSISLVYLLIAVTWGIYIEKMSGSKARFWGSFMIGLIWPLSICYVMRELYRQVRENG
jgi:hypothetical protein